MPAVELIDMVRAAQRGPRPEWGRSSEHPSVLVETARGDLGLSAGARALQEFLDRTKTVALEVARTVTRDGQHEVIYVRCGQPPSDEDLVAAEPTGPQPDLGPVTEQVEQMTRDLASAVSGVKS